MENIVDIKNSLKTKLNEFARMEDGWNGYSAVVPKESTIQNVLLAIDLIEDKYIKLLNDEDVVPSTYGTVSLYFYDTKNNQLVVEFGKDFIGICGEIDGKEIAIDDVPVSRMEHRFPLQKLLSNFSNDFFKLVYTIVVLQLSSNSPPAGDDSLTVYNNI